MPFSSHSTETRIGLGLYSLISILYCSFFVIYEIPPFQDYPNHLLEAQVIAHPDKFSPHYHLNWRPVPNLTSQVFLSTLSGIVSIHTLGRWFCAITVLVFGLGAFLFTTVFLKRQYIAGLVLFLFCFHFFFWRGYMNFSLGTALLLLFLPLSHETREKFAHPWALGLDILFAVILYFTHFFPAGIFILLNLARRVFGSERSFRSAALLCLPILALSFFYVTRSEGQSFSWDYGTGLWKLFSLKRLIAMPYVSTIDHPGLFLGINLYNLPLYSGFVLITGWSLRSISRVGEKLKERDPFVLSVIFLLFVYAVLPSKLGKLEVDRRVSFFLILLCLPHLLVLFLETRPKASRWLFVSLLLWIGFQSVLVSFQFQSAQARLADHIARASAHSGRREDRVAIDQYFRLNHYAGQSVFHRLLAGIKLHTDVSQVTRVEEHADCYYYFGGGFPRKLFTTSVIAKAGQINE